MTKLNTHCLIKWSAILLWAAMAVQVVFMADGFIKASAALPNTVGGLSSPPDVIILMGFPQSGSDALHEYFECHGMQSRHYCCHENYPANPRTSFPCPDSKSCGACVLQNLKEGSKGAFDGCTTTTKRKKKEKGIQIWSAFDVETDKGWFLPQHFAIGLLHQQYPNAVWILNSRASPNDWATSVYHWHSRTRRFLHSFGLNDGVSEEEPKSVEKPHIKAKVKDKDVEADLENAVARESDSNLLARRERIVPLLEEIYVNHTRTIHEWGRQFPSHRLVEIHVDDDASAIRSRLDFAFGQYYSSSQHHQQKCEWNYQPPDDDWKNFALPY
eukprot:scaffold431_cov103-Cylindrotheca_fusiformis.AAC.8